MNGNLFSQIPADLPEELTEILHQQAKLRIERIISKAHHSPDDFWYCQSQHEWVLLLRGQAQLAFDDQSSIQLNPGDYLFIPAQRRHRVDWTAPDTETVWLAIFFDPDA
jgi:cupin 2 domain-containing protein